MNRAIYYDYIEERLHTLAARIETSGKLNHLHLHMHSENFYLHFLNLLFGYQLENANKSLQNVAAIDLIDHKNKIVIQVSSTATKEKIESALTKDIIKQYSAYEFMFLSISKDASRLKRMTFNNKYCISFDPTTNIFDIKSLLSQILSAKAPKLQEIYEFIKKELGTEVDIPRLESNLAHIINILAQENWSIGHSEPAFTFEIDRKIAHNQLVKAKDLIEEYRIYHAKVESKYSEFDKLGNNKSYSVLATISREYRKVRGNKNADDIFFEVIDVLKKKIMESANYSDIPIDELELCVDILVVDAFIRCKIMENPVGYKYATT